MALTESQAAFEQRCDEIVGDGTLKNALVAAGVSTYSLLAFSVGTPRHHQRMISLTIWPLGFLEGGSR